MTFKEQLQQIEKDVAAKPSAAESATELSYRLCQLLTDTIDIVAKGTETEPGATFNQLKPLYELCDGLKELRVHFGAAVVANT